MTTYLGKSCSFGLPQVPFVNCCQFMYLVIYLSVLRAGCGIWLYQFLIIAYLFTLKPMRRYLQKKCSCSYIFHWNSRHWLKCSCSYIFHWNSRHWLKCSCTYRCELKKNLTSQYRNTMSRYIFWRQYLWKEYDLPQYKIFCLIVWGKNDRMSWARTFFSCCQPCGEYFFSSFFAMWHFFFFFFSYDNLHLHRPHAPNIAWSLR